MKKILLFVVIGVFLQSCSQKVGAELIANTKWTLTEWPGRTIPVNGLATLNFSDPAKIGGKSFCNVYGGTSEIYNGTVKFSQIIGTKMFCNEFSDAENQYHADLLRVDGIKMSGSNLHLLKDGQVVMVFKKTE